LTKKLEQNYGSLSQFKQAFQASALGMTGSGWLWLVMDDKGLLGIVGTYGAGTVLVQARQQRGDFSELPQQTTLTDQSIENMKKSSQDGRSTSRTQPANPSSDSLLQTGDHRSALDNLLEKAAQGTREPSLNPALKLADLGKQPSSTPSSSSTKDNLLNQALGKSSFSSSSFKTETTFHPLFALSIHEHAWIQDYGIWGKEEYVKNFWKVLDWEKVGSVYTKLVPKSIMNP